MTLRLRPVMSRRRIRPPGLAGRLVAEAIQGQSERLDVFARLRHHRFPGGSMLRTPALALAMAWERLRDAC